MSTGTAKTYWKPLIVYMTPEMREETHRFAASQDLSASQVIRHLLRREFEANAKTKEQPLRS